MSQVYLGLLTLLLVNALMTDTVRGNVVVFGRGSCPQLSGMADFDASRYLGKWYEYERFGNWFERKLKCVYANYEDNGDGSIEVENGGIDVNTEEDVSIKAAATIPDDSKPGELKVRFSPFDPTRKANYIVVDTDYDEYAVVFSCFKLPFFPLHVQFAWILTRDRGTAPSNLDALRESLRLEDRKVRTSKFLRIDQTGCTN